MNDPTRCSYAPPGEYIKDHTIVFHDGRYHLFSISGTAGYYHGYTGNEETISWSISRDLVEWKFRGHVLHASGWEGFFDQHEIWAPFCIKTPAGFLMFYTGIVHPHRPMEYRRLGHDHPWVCLGHRETQGIARSRDLTEWVKISDYHAGAGVPGRDSHVVRDENNERWLLYSTIGNRQVHLAESHDLEDWTPLGLCGEFPPDAVAESLTVMRHPLNGRWIMLGNGHYILSDDPARFDPMDARAYDTRCGGRPVRIGFAGEMLHVNARWYRSGVLGRRDHFRLGFTEIEWDADAAFRIVRPSILA